MNGNYEAKFVGGFMRYSELVVSEEGSFDYCLGYVEGYQERAD